MEGIAGSTLVAFAVTCLVIELTPGPNMAYLAILSAEKGRRSGFAATVGIAIGLLAIGIAAALGLAGISAVSPSATKPTPGTMWPTSVVRSSL